MFRNFKLTFEYLPQYELLLLSINKSVTLKLFLLEAVAKTEPEQNLLSFIISIALSCSEFKFPIIEFMTPYLRSFVRRKTTHDESKSESKFFYISILNQL